MSDINADLHDLPSEKTIDDLEGEVGFVPKPGQIDYTNIKYAPVINCMVVHDGKILIVQRNQKMRYYPGYWSGIAGFLDDTMTVDEKARYELEDEAKISSGDILKITEGKIFEQEEKAYKKIWVVHPVRVDVKTSAIKLDWEAQDHQWIEPKDISLYKLIPGFENVVREFFPPKRR